MSKINDDKKEFVTVNNLKRFLQNADERFAPNKNMEGIKSDGSGGYIAGKSGLVPAPPKSSNGKFLRSDGTWAAPGALPTGSYIQFAGSQAPAGFLVCNGGEISRTTYSALFAVIGTTYGSGDGSTTFNLPDLTDRFLQGSSTSGTVKNAGLPNITAYVPYLGSGTPGNDSVFSGALAREDVVQGGGYGPSGVWSLVRNITFDASRSSSIYGNSTTVQPPALTCLICIKY